MKELKQGVKGRPVVSAKGLFGDAKVEHLKNGGVLEMNSQTVKLLRTRFTPYEMETMNIQKSTKLENTYWVSMGGTNE